MKIKNILVFLTLGMAGCVGLEQYPTDSFTDETYWKYEENVKAALYLGYNQTWGEKYYFNNNVLSDDTYGSTYSSGQREVAIGLANTANGRFKEEWEDCYRALRTIHTVLDAQDYIDTGDPAFKERMLAEVRMMRAFVYFRLITWFGDVPFLTTNPTIASSKVIPRTDEAVIRAFILEELDYAASVLPKNTEIPVAENGRFTCGTAIAIKARVYLLENDFENCAKECAKLINTTEYGTYELADSYEKLFHDQSYAYGRESIMTLEYAAREGVSDVVRGWDQANGWLPQSIGSKGVTTMSPTQELVDAYRKLDGSIAGDTDYLNRDERFYTTIAYNGCTVVIPAIRGLGVVGSEGVGKGTYVCYTRKRDEDANVPQDQRGQRYDVYTGTEDRTMTGYYSLKNYNPDMVNSGGKSYKSLIEIRYADILLMYAESMYETGEMSSAIWDQTIRPLRKRAGFSEAYCAYPGGDVRQTIRNERRVELAMEGRRTFDVRRWAVLDNPSIKTTGAVVLTSQATGAPFRDDNTSIICTNPYSMKYWFAIPQAERNVNKNLTQNPGW